MQALLGLVLFPFIAWLFSEDRKNVNVRLVVGGILLQFLFAILLLYLPFLREVIASLGDVVLAIDKATKDGTQFLFGYLAGGDIPFKMKAGGGDTLLLAFQVLPIILVVSAISSVLYHFGILQRVVWGFSWLLKKFMRLDGPTGLAVSSSVFLGIIEAPLFVKPYLNKMPRSSLFTLMVASMATVAGTVMVLYASILEGMVENASGQILIASLMSAPAAVVIARLMIPGSSAHTPQTNDEILQKPQTESSFEALVNGTTDGLQMILNIVAMIIVLFSLVSLVNMGLGALIPGFDLTLEKLLGYLFWPFCWAMGIPIEDLSASAELMGVKIILNEFVSYSRMAQMEGLQEKTQLILTYAMCGFANLASLGILIGGLRPLMPDRKREVIDLSFRSLIAGILATLMTGSIMGIIATVLGTA